MSNFLKRNALSGGVAMLSLLGTMYAPVSLAGDGHDEHAHSHDHGHRYVTLFLKIQLT